MPSGASHRFPPIYEPDSNGSFRFIPYDASSPALMEIGTCELFGEGSESGKTESVYFEVEPALTLIRPLRVFLCHASEDKPAARKLYRQLKAGSVDPWLDEEELLPGQNWKSEITKAVRSSDVILICLSSKSINKTGYVQKEIRIALDVADEQPQDSIFLIPVKLEECDVPERLRHWQWVNLFEYKGFERLILALRVRADELGLTLSAVRA